MAAVRPVHAPLSPKNPLAQADGMAHHSIEGDKQLSLSPIWGMWDATGLFEHPSSTEDR